MRTATAPDTEQVVAKLSARLQRLEDIEQIQAMHRTYVRHLVNQQWDQMVALFTATAVVDLGHDGVRRGHEDIAALFGLFDAFYANGNPRAGYVLSSPVIEATGHDATGTWTLHRFAVDGSWTEDRYHCEYRKTTEGWRFSHLQLRAVVSATQPEPGP
ncbi:nuclear transport factor 2 family protein [Nocardia altamirensis]|uniref:nuclear transport factor 2 family protein n=1 Tax=Nocardia altamirensis TaxID=472158 RepID=UPI00083FE022|nr:nuclear transport factor 2 family protein [Nocardia altamirensis]